MINKKIAVLYFITMIFMTGQINYSNITINKETQDKVVSPDNSEQQSFEKGSNMNLLECLEEKINENMKLDEMVYIFEEMCKIPIEAEDDVKLFEMGSFSFSEKPYFYFSLVRQYQLVGEDEYMQLRLDIIYQPDNKNKKFNETVWSDEFESDAEFFKYIRSSNAYHYLENIEMARYEISLDQT